MKPEQILAMAERVLSGDHLSPDEAHIFCEAGREFIRDEIERRLVAAMDAGADLGEAVGEVLDEAREFAERNPTLRRVQ